MIRRHAEIGVPVGERIESGLEQFDLPERPDGMISEIERLPEGGILVTLPRQGFSGPLATLACVMAIFVAFMLIGPWLILRFVDGGPKVEGRPNVRLADHPFFVCLYAPGILFGAASGFIVVGAARTQVRVRIAPHELEVTGGLWKRVIPMAALEEVRVTGKGGHWRTPCLVMVRSSTSSAQFGGSRMTRAEGDYLAGLIKAAAAGREQS